LLTWGLAVAPAARGDEPKAGRQKAEALDKDIKVHVHMKYLLYLPEGYDAKGDKTWPLVLFLHGAGESGNDLGKVKKHGPPKLVEGGKNFPFIVVSPQSARGGWSPDVLNALLDEVKARYKVDPDRVYLTGLSMGGFGTWTLAAAHPQRFAAIVPICGGGDPLTAAKIKDIPAWVFHGAKDEVVRPDRSKVMVDALRKAGGNVRFTLYEDAGHDSWTETYNNQEMWDWLLQQRRGKGKEGTK
jgi:predicted peptidase